MELAKLQELGAFVAPTPVKEQVTWQPPEGEQVTFTVHIKRLSGGAMERLWSQSSSDKSNSATLISEVVLLGEDGKERFNYQQAFDLDPPLMEVLLRAVDKVNPIKRRSVKAAKN